MTTFLSRLFILGELRGEVAEADGKTLCAPCSRRAVEDSGARRSATAATAVVREIPLGHHVPVPADDRLAAIVTVGTAAGLIVHIARVDVAKAVLHRDPPGHRQRGGRGRRFIEHLVVRMKGGEVKRHIRAEVLHHPLGQFLDLLL